MAETADTIYRIDLAEAGWDKEPFFIPRTVKDTKGKDKELRIPVKANLFDLVLLEYPHAVIPEDQTNFSELAKKFLVLANQVRPVPYVRGDWFVAANGSFARERPEGVDQTRGRKLPPAFASNESQEPPAGPEVPPADGCRSRPSTPGTTSTERTRPTPERSRVSVSLLKVKPEDQKDMFLGDPMDTFREPDVYPHDRRRAALCPVRARRLGRESGKTSAVQAVPAGGEIELKISSRRGFGRPPRLVSYERLRVYAAAH